MTSCTICKTPPIGNMLVVCVGEINRFSKTPSKFRPFYDIRCINLYSIQMRGAGPNSCGHDRTKNADMGTHLRPTRTSMRKCIKSRTGTDAIHHGEGIVHAWYYCVQWQAFAKARHRSRPAIQKSCMTVKKLPRNSTASVTSLEMQQSRRTLMISEQLLLKKSCHGTATKSLAVLAYGTPYTA